MHRYENYYYYSLYDITFGTYGFQSHSCLYFIATNFECGLRLSKRALPYLFLKDL
jgi:hypothetical protein